jgi:preprotein translocase SecE subunit
MEALKRFFSKVGRYFVGAVKELRRVRWPKGKTLANYISIVIFFVVFWGVYLYVINVVVVELLKSVNSF